MDVAIADNNLILDYQDGKFGTADITVLGTSNGKTVTNTFTVTVEADPQPIIAITDSSGDPDDKTIIFGTPLSEYNSDLVRPNYPDLQQYIDLTNSGNAPLDISEVQVNADNVAVDIPEEDILLNPNETQRIQLSYTPAQGGESFNLEDGLVIKSNAVNISEVYINLAGQSTFDSDINYDGKVNAEDLEILNTNIGLEDTNPNWNRAIDINADGLISFGDLTLLNQQWNQEI